MPRLTPEEMEEAKKYLDTYTRTERLLQSILEELIKIKLEIRNNS